MLGNDQSRTYTALPTIFVSFFIVAFGQPAWCSWLGLVSAICGYALFWRGMWAFASLRHRFWVATGWFFAVQAVQLSWFLSHPYSYIYAVWFGLSLMLGFQFGLFSLLVTPTRVASAIGLLAIASVWTIFEWLRLFFLAGFTFNPAGLALTGHIAPLQMASFVGVFGLSFWVIVVNLFALRLWSGRARLFPWVMVALLPYILGWGHIAYRKQQFAAAPSPSTVRAILVQPGVPSDAIMAMPTLQDQIDFGYQQWRTVLQLLRSHRKAHTRSIDLIVLPEGVAPFDADVPLYRLQDVQEMFQEQWGENALEFLPKPSGHTVSNAYVAQGIANGFESDVVAGLQEVEKSSTEGLTEEFLVYNAAFLFRPYGKGWEVYRKRVLVPMGEYIPFSWCRKLAARYGVHGSFQAGKEPKIFKGQSVPLGITICYEETFGHLMRENRLQGAKMLVNITDDGWYPLSRLHRQHFDLARLRTVEMGIPLVRACNTGITAAVDSLGRVVASIGDDINPPPSPQALLVEVPVNVYSTLYAKTGDFLILGISILILCSLLLKNLTLSIV